MSSLEALEKFKLLYESKCKEQPKNLIGFDMCYITIKQDLEMLKHIKNLRTTPNALETSLAKYMNKCIELEKENQELKNDLSAVEFWNERYIEHNDKLKKVIEILEDKLEFEDLGEMQSGNVYRPYFNDCFDQQEYDFLKEVFRNGGE